MGNVRPNHGIVIVMMLGAVVVVVFWFRTLVAGVEYEELML